MLPFAGLKVIDVSRVLAGPYCCALLGDLGAQVIKIERPGDGDENRHWGHSWNGVGLDFLNVNRSKRDITIDLSTSEGQQIVRELIKDADVLVENFLTGTMEKFGLAYDDLKVINPRLIYCSITGYGDRGAFKSKPGYDGAIQAFSGHMMVTGEPDSGPVRTGASVIDMSTGIAAYSAIVTALYGRMQTGVGQRVSASLLKTALSLMGTHGAVYLNTGKEPTRAGAGVSHLAPYGAFKTKDAYVVTGVLNAKSWEKLCQTLGLEKLIADPKFIDMQQRLLHRKELDQILTDVFMTKTSAEWIASFEAAGIVISPVNSLGEALDHPQVADNGMILSFGNSDDALRLVGAPMSFDSWDISKVTPPPELGADTDPILDELGYSPQTVLQLRSRSIV